VDYLRSLEDSEATREACRQYLQRYIAYIRPIMPEHVERAKALLKSVGGRMETRPARWPYRAIEAVCGAKMAESARRRIAQVKRAVRSLQERTRPQ
jgi:hypothetical protein